MDNCNIKHHFKVIVKVLGQEKIMVSTTLITAGSDSVTSKVTCVFRTK